jgi:fatty-acyl-CoA synthase
VVNTDEVSARDAAARDRTPFNWPLEHSLGALLEAVAGIVPDRPALVERGTTRREWTYRQLLDSAAALARRMLQTHEPGEAVAIWAPNSAEWVLLDLAASLAGVVVVPVNPAFKESELRFALEQSGARSLFYEREHHAHDRTAAAERMRQQLSLRMCTPMSDVLTLAGDAPSDLLLPQVRNEDTAMVLFTSGTTGVPKGAVLRHTGLVNAAWQMLDRLGFSTRRPPVYINTMPFFHVGGCGTALIGTIAHHGTHVLLPHFDPAAVLDAIAAEIGSCMLAVPAMMSDLIAEQSAHPREVSSLTAVLSGGANVPGDLVTRFADMFGCQVFVSYGQTEAHGALVSTLLGDPEDRLSNTVGTPFPGVELQVVDVVTRQPLPVGADGEVCFRGYLVMSGYHGQEGATSEAISSEGWMSTGDIGHMRDDGYLVLSGRLKEMLIRGGENVYPREIENVLQRELGAEVAVVGVPDPRLGEEVAVILSGVTAQHPEQLLQRLLGRCAEELAAYKVPRYWYIVDEFPRTSTGKLQKTLLVSRIVEGSLQAAYFTSSVRDRQLQPLPDGEVADLVRRRGST